MLNKSAVINLAVGFASLCVVNFCCAQAVGPAVEIPTSRTALIDLSSNGNDAPSLTVASEFKSTAKNVVEQEKPVFWNWYAEFGYESEYNFRGTNLTPDADGAMFLDLEVSKWGFTLGAYDVHQLGTARAKSWSMGEGGGGGTGTFSFFPGFPGISLMPETTQSYFNEIDVFLQYNRSFGPVEVTVGNIGFFINREAKTLYTEEFLGFKFGPFPESTVGDEQFDRVFVRLATSAIPHIQPWITYYQTIYSQGQDKGVLGGGGFPPIHERNDELGGYLEGRLRGNFPIGEWVDVNPYAIVSVSFHDRTEPVENPVKLHDIIRPKTLSGFNHAQFGVELPIHILHFAGTSTSEWAPPDVRVNLVPFGAYSYHISTPTAGTDRDEWWGGVKLAVTF